MGVKEKVIQANILRHLNWCEIFVWRNNSVGIWDAKKKLYRKNRNPFAIKGVSDILGLHQGKFIAIEVKSKAGRLTEDQQKFIENVNNSGGIGLMARSIDDVFEVLCRHFPTNYKLSMLYDSRRAQQSSSPTT